MPSEHRAAMARSGKTAEASAANGASHSRRLGREATLRPTIINQRQQTQLYPTNSATPESRPRDYLALAATALSASMTF
jgi:hypothetical protein